MTNARSFRTGLTAALMLVLVLAPVGLAAEGGGSGGIDPSGDPGAGGADGGGGPAATPTSDGVFPIIGAHTYGDGLGAGRNHQGQDLIAKCGKPIVAAQGGRVQVNDTHASAGNYVVIKSKSTRTDQVYMHMISPSRLAEGERVRTGEKIGRVGTTGNSSTCHLHFEKWSAPGWYKGGSVLDPTPSLKRWDRAGR